MKSRGAIGSDVEYGARIPWMRGLPRTGRAGKPLPGEPGSDGSLGLRQNRYISSMP